MYRILIPLVAAGVIAFVTPSGAEQSPGAVEVWKSPSCECCGGWVNHMQRSGYKVKTNSTTDDILDRIKRQAGVPESLQSCHTAKIGGYVIEGHVPAKDIERLLAERPDAIGLAVPGMPLGSPGMDYGPDKEPYEVLLLKKNGSTEVFAKH